MDGWPLGIHPLASASASRHVRPTHSIAVARHVHAWSTGSRHGRMPWQRPRLAQQSS